MCNVKAAGLQRCNSAQKFRCKLNALPIPKLFWEEVITSNCSIPKSSKHFEILDVFQDFGSSYCHIASTGRPDTYMNILP